MANSEELKESPVSGENKEQSPVVKAEDALQNDASPKDASVPTSLDQKDLLKSESEDKIVPGAVLKEKRKPMCEEDRPSKAHATPTPKHQKDPPISDVESKIVSDEVLSERLKPKCDCADAVDDVLYSHMGHAKDLETLRVKFSEACSVQGSRIKIVVVEKVLSDRMEGCIDCPLPPAEDHICRRDTATEDVLVLALRHSGHVCDYAFTVKSVVVWEGVEKELADEAYLTTKTHLPQSGNHLKRGCATNSQRDCNCQGQGQSEDTKGVSFSFGCSWSTYTQGCKFKQSRRPRKFNLGPYDSGGCEGKIVGVLTNKLADTFAPALEKVAPGAYGNQVEAESAAPECCLGKLTKVKKRKTTDAKDGEEEDEDDEEYGSGGEEADATDAATAAGSATASVPSLKDQPRRPFSSVTICLDFSAHRHKDTSNMVGGCTVVATFLRDSGSAATAAAKGKEEEKKPSAGSGKTQQQKAEQLHILPAYGVAGAKHAKSNFRGVGIALTHGSILYEYARAEWHATSPVLEPNRFDPTRISYVFYRHRGLIAPRHGYRTDWLKIRDCQRAARREARFCLKFPRHPEAHLAFTRCSASFRRASTSHVADGGVAAGGLKVVDVKAAAVLERQLAIAASDDEDENDDGNQNEEKDQMEEGQNIDYLMHLLHDEKALDSALGEADISDESIGNKSLLSSSGSAYPTAQMTQQPRPAQQLPPLPPPPQLQQQQLQQPQPQQILQPPQLNHQLPLIQIRPSQPTQHGSIIPIQQQQQPMQIQRPIYLQQQQKIILLSSPAGGLNPSTTANTVTLVQQPSFVVHQSPVVGNASSSSSTVPSNSNIVPAPQFVQITSSSIRPNTVRPTATSNVVQPSQTNGLPRLLAPAPSQQQQQPQAPVPGATIIHNPSNQTIADHNRTLSSDSSEGNSSPPHSSTQQLSTDQKEQPYLVSKSPSTKNGTHPQPLKIPGEVKRMQCPICFKTFSSSGNANRHIKATHFGIKEDCAVKKKHSLDSSPSRSAGGGSGEDGAGGNAAKRFKFISSATNSSEDSSTYSPNSPSSHYTPNFGSQTPSHAAVGSIGPSDQYSTASQSSSNAGDAYQPQQQQPHIYPSQGDQQLQQQQQPQQPQHLVQQNGASTSSSFLFAASNEVSQDDPFSGLSGFGLDAFASSQPDAAIGPFPQQNSQHHFSSQQRNGFASPSTSSPSSGLAVRNAGSSSDYVRSFGGFSEGEVESAGNTFYAQYGGGGGGARSEEEAAYMPTNGYANVESVESNNGVYQNFPNYLSL